MSHRFERTYSFPEPRHVCLSGFCVHVNPREVGQIFSEKLGHLVTVYAKLNESDEDAIARVRRRHKKK